jgi:predicted tellurium resistance membrane protein TerC
MESYHSIRFLEIVGINLLLSVDNGLVIALAVRKLASPARTQVLLASAVCAVIFQTMAALFASALLGIRFFRLAAGGFLLWIGFDSGRGNPPRAGRPDGPAASRAWRVVLMVVAANFMVSADNTLAIAAAAGANRQQMIVAVALSVPLVVLAGDLLAQALTRVRFLAVSASALLAFIGAQLVMTDAAWGWLNPTESVREAAAVLAATGAIGANILQKRNMADNIPTRKPGTDDVGDARHSHDSRPIAYSRTPARKQSSKRGDRRSVGENDGRRPLRGGEPRHG